MKKYEHGGNIWVKENPSQWLDFSANINPYGPPNIIVETLEQSISQVTKYPEPYGNSARIELAKYLGIDETQVLLTSGGIRAMELVMRSIAPKHSLIIQPGFVEYERLSKIYSHSFENIVAFQEDGQYKLDLTAIENRLDKSDVLFLCHPSNPVGKVFYKEDLSKLMSLCKRYNVKMIIDEAFIHYCPEQTLINEINSYCNIIIVGSLTKIFSIPGVRIGYIAANNKLLKRIEQKFLPWSINIFAQAIVKAINTPQIKEFEALSVANNNKARKIMNKELSKLGFKVYESVTNYLLLNTSSLKQTASQINNKLAKYNVMVRDCSNFVGLNSSFIRVAVKNEDQNQYLINCFKEVL